MDLYVFVRVLDALIYRFVQCALRRTSCLHAQTHNTHEHADVHMHADSLRQRVVVGTLVVVVGTLVVVVGTLVALSQYYCSTPCRVSSRRTPSAAIDQVYLREDT